MLTICMMNLIRSIYFQPFCFLYLKCTSYSIKLFFCTFVYPDNLCCSIGIFNMLYYNYKFNVIIIIQLYFNVFIHILIMISWSKSQIFVLNNNMILKFIYIYQRKKNNHNNFVKKDQKLWGIQYLISTLTVNIQWSRHYTIGKGIDKNNNEI